VALLQPGLELGRRGEEQDRQLVRHRGILAQGILKGVLRPCRSKQFCVPARFRTGAIAAGPEGRIWFTTGPRRAAIESISAKGKVGGRVCLEKACTLPPSSLAFAPDGTLWFGTEVYTCVYCGGGSALMALQYPGDIGFLRSR
jgi:hypothetical protein